MDIKKILIVFTLSIASIFASPPSWLAKQTTNGIMSLEKQTT